MTASSILERHRLKFRPTLPDAFAKGLTHCSIRVEPSTASKTKPEIQEFFPHTHGQPKIDFHLQANQITVPQPIKLGVLLSGGQAPGGHNVISGIYDALQSLHPDCELIGFIGGPSGLIDGKWKKLDKQLIDSFRNTGGFDIIGSGRTKLDTPHQFDKSMSVLQNLKLDGLIVIGGDDSNTNAAILAEYIKGKGMSVSIIGVPKTIDGDLKNVDIPISFGFDTAVKTYAELVGNIARDACSARKYWHFIRLMGRSASHVTLEVGLQVRPNITLISEEVAEKKMSLKDITEQVCESIVSRAQKDKNYGIVLIPEGLIEFVPSVRKLISELNETLATHPVDDGTPFSEKMKIIRDSLPPDSEEIMNSLPIAIQEQLLFDRDPHGNVQVSRIETDYLLVHLVEKRLNQLKKSGHYIGKFSNQRHFFGYEGRCAFPTNFDANYTYALGFTAAALAWSKYTAYISVLSGVEQNSKKWIPGGAPLPDMLNFEQRHGKKRPVIKKALVDLKGVVFKTFLKNRTTWSREDCFQFPGPIQYFGPSELCDSINQTLLLESGLSD